MRTTKDMEPNSTWTALSARVASRSVSAGDISKWVGASPTRAAEAGEAISPRSPLAGVHDSAFCIYQSPLAASASIQEHFAWLVGFLQGLKSRPLPIPEGIQIDVRLGFSSSAGQGGFALSAAELSLLGDLGVQLNVDLYPPDAEDD